MTVLSAKISKSVKERFYSWSGHTAILKALTASKDVDCVLTGGVVRDTILDVTDKINDFDLIITGPNFSKFVDLLTQEGELTKSAFGCIRWFPSIGTAYADILNVTSFYAGIQKCNNVRDVLMNFDFTGNAIGVDLMTDLVINPTFGIEDLQVKVMKAVRYDFPDIPIYPKSKLTYLGANIVRCRHYAERLKLKIDPITQQWIDSYQKFDEMLEAYETLLGELPKG